MSYIVIIISLVFLVLNIGIAIYNSLIKKKNDVDNALASIDVILRKRHDGPGEPVF